MFSIALSSPVAVAENSLRDDGVDGHRDLAGKLVEDGLGLTDQVRLRKRLADPATGGEDKCVGDAAADDQAVDLRRQCAQDRELGRHLGPGHDGHQRPFRMRQRAAECVEFRRQQRTRARDRGEFGETVRRRLRPVRGAEGIVDVDVAELRHPLRQFVDVLLFALVHPAVLEQDDLTRLERVLPCPAVDPVAYQRHIETEQLRQAAGDRRKGVVRRPLPFRRPAQVRRDHDRRRRAPARREPPAPRRESACRR